MIFDWFIATNVDEVGISWFDFYSIGHICFGIGVFLIVSLLYTIPKKKGYTPIFSLFATFIVSVIVMVLWEVLENILFIAWGIKYEGRQDSLQNMFTDVLIGVIGALMTWLFAYVTFEKDKKIWPYYIFGLLAFAIWLGFFIILRYLTYWNTPFIN